MTSILPPDRLSLTSLRIFVAIAEERNLTRAAGREAIALSAASKRLADLEADFGVRLLDRTPRGMRLTAAGESLLHHARRVLGAAQDLTADMSDFRKGVRGHVRLLANLSAIVAYLPEDLERFFLNHPDLRVDLQERPSLEVVRGVEEGQAELGICSAHADLQGLTVVPYKTDDLVVVMRADHPLAGRGPLAFRDTLAFDHIGLHAESSIFMRSQRAARDEGMSLRRRIHVPGFDAVCRTVQAGLGVALIPAPVFGILGSSMSLHAEALTDPWARREIVIVHQSARPLSAAAERLHDALRRG
ncbi:LysR substrate-binding domain-containing protein [Falsirhodobacter sp. 20TX0035]|uniref:LysR substrate-binding domain-containing protein n=1 Tax=Falsirhodobacter sp. 20TX0035 TaxID=3022019 RepID=UPI0023310A39|nr:LysR substrate-binding domain-containing protein [Falsirhodobacter sp. 20TX0035]MDB6453771.1 LysR substrate-binding domain-containing protein [Falsirhodobacter sp. 20TX0035]